MQTTIEYRTFMQTLATQLGTAPAAEKAAIDAHMTRLNQTPGARLMSQADLEALHDRIAAFAQKQTGVQGQALTHLAEAIDASIRQHFDELDFEALPAMPTPVSEAVFAPVRQRSSRDVLPEKVAKMATAIPPDNGLTKGALQALYPSQLSAYIDTLYNAAKTHAGVGAMAPVPYEGMDIQMGYFRRTKFQLPVLLLDRASFDYPLKAYLDSKAALLRVNTRESPTTKAPRKQRIEYDETVSQPFTHICKRPNYGAGKALREALLAGIERAKAAGTKPDAQELFTLEVEGQTIRANEVGGKKATLIIARDCSPALENAWSSLYLKAKTEEKKTGWRAQINAQHRPYSREKMPAPPSMEHPAILKSNWGGKDSGGRGGR
jgi:hypothetical protein